MVLRDVNTFGILGAGTLGWKIGLQAAISGFDVLMLDTSAAQLAQASEFQRRLLNRCVRKGIQGVTDEELEHILGRISSTTEAARFSESVDFVSESVTEDLDLKRRVWAQFAGTWRDDAVLTTNTSYLLASQMADFVGDEARFCAFHFHDVFEARVVDIMPHAKTDASVVPFLETLGKRLNQIPVHVQQETPGYLYNFMLMAFLGAAGHLLSTGKADHLAIDRSWMGNMQTRIGPYGMMDMIGLDTVDKILSVRTDRRSLAFREAIAPLIAAGHLGVKSGKGFYDYPRPAFTDPSFLG